MKKLLQRVLIMVSCLVCACGAQAADSTASSFSAEQRSEIERIVHDYLVAHPEVMFEVAAEVEKLQQEQAAKVLNDTVSALRSDPGTPKAGPEDGEHYFIEFSDYNCGYCKTVRPYTERLIKEHNLQAVYVEFPILSQLSVQAAATGLALYRLSPEQYFIYQKKMMTAGTKVESYDDIKAALTAAGADEAKVRSLAQSAEIQSQLRFNIEQGQRLGVTGTPFFIINGRPVRGAVRDYESLERMAGF